MEFQNDVAEMIQNMDPEGLPPQFQTTAWEAAVRPDAMPDSDYAPECNCEN